MSAISGAMKVKAMAWASGTRPIPQKKRNAMTVNDHASRNVDLERRPARPWKAAPEVAGSLKE